MNLDGPEERAPLSLLAVVVVALWLGMIAAACGAVWTVPTAVAWRWGATLVVLAAANAVTLYVLGQ